MEIFRLFGSIFIKDDEAQKSLRKTDDKAGKVAETLGKAAKAAIKWGAIIGTAATAAGGALLALTKKSAESADALLVNAQKAGVTTDAYQEMSYALGQAGMEQNSINRALERLNQRIGLAEEGNKGYIEALNKLTISTRDANNEIR